MYPYAPRKSCTTHPARASATAAAAPTGPPAEPLVHTTAARPPPPAHRKEGESTHLSSPEDRLSSAPTLSALLSSHGAVRTIQVNTITLLTPQRATA